MDGVFIIILCLFFRLLLFDGWAVDSSCCRIASACYLPFVSELWMIECINKLTVKVNYCNRSFGCFSLMFDVIGNLSVCLSNVYLFKLMRMIMCKSLDNHAIFGKWTTAKTIISCNKKKDRLETDVTNITDKCMALYNVRETIISVFCTFGEVVDNYAALAAGGSVCLFQWVVGIELRMPFIFNG